MTGLTPGRAPCAFCPYRRDVPSGVWARTQYELLRGYDGSTTDQILAGVTRLFMCHKANGHLCAGWVGCHDMDESLALRFHSDELDLPAVMEYVSPVPLFSSGAEAADHGERDLRHPSDEARAAVALIARLRARRNSPVTISDPDEE